MVYEPLASGDPLGGDPETILALVRVLQSHASECENLNQSVTNAGVESWVGDAAIAFQAKKQEFAPKLSQLTMRLSGAGAALLPFANALQSIQSEAQNLAAAARALQGEMSSLAPGVDRQEQHRRDQELGILVGKPPTPWSGPDYIGAMEVCRGRFIGLQQRFANLLGEYQATASNCASALNSISHDGLANSLFSVLAYESQLIGHDIDESWQDADRWWREHQSEILRVLHDLGTTLSIIAAVFAAAALIAATGGAATPVVALLGEMFGFATALGTVTGLATMDDDAYAIRDGEQHGDATLIWDSVSTLVSFIPGTKGLIAGGVVVTTQWFDEHPSELRALTTPDIPAVKSLEWVWSGGAPTSGVTSAVMPQIPGPESDLVGAID